MMDGAVPNGRAPLAAVLALPNQLRRLTRAGVGALEMRRRLLLARSLVHRPRVLVLDEPTNGLDLQARHQLLAILGDLARSGTTLLLVTHQIEAIIPEIQRCVLLRQGQIVGHGSSDDLLQDGPLSALFDTPLRVIEAQGYRQVVPARKARLGLDSGPLPS